MRRLPLLIVSLLGLNFAFASAATAATVGAEVGISSISPCPSFCGGSGATFDNAFDGGEGVDFASTSLDNVATLGHGVGMAEADFTGAGFLPILRGLSDSQPNAQVATGSTAYQGFTYSGGSSTLQLDITLNGQAAAAAALDAVIEATVVIVTGSDLPHSTHAPTFLFEFIPGTEGIDICGSAVSLSINDSTPGPQTRMGSAVCDIEDGQDFFVWANLTTRGTRGGEADAFNTLTMAWDDDTGIAVIPEPSTGLLLACGLIGLGARSSRRGRR